MSADTAFEVGRLFAPLKAISDTLTAAQKDIFIRLPGLAGYYPMSVVTNTGAAAEHSQGGTQLSETGTVPLAFDGNAYRHLGNGTNYLSAVGVYGLTGTEAYIEAGLRGLTIGAWCMVDTVPAVSGSVVSRDGVASNRGYSIIFNSSLEFRFILSGTGGAAFVAQGLPTTLGVWHFAVGRFLPSTEIAIIVDGDKQVNTTAIPASCNVSTQAFEVGRNLNDNTRILHAKIRDLFICRSSLSDQLIEEVRQSSVP